MTGTSGFGMTVTVLVVLASLAGVCVLAVSVLRRSTNQRADEVTPHASTTTINERMGRDSAGERTGQQRRPNGSARPDQ